MSQPPRDSSEAPTTGRHRLPAQSAAWREPAGPAAAEALMLSDRVQPTPGFPPGAGCGWSVPVVVQAVSGRILTQKCLLQNLGKAGLFYRSHSYF